MIAEEAGALSFMGRANANVARMVVDEINTNGGLLGRKIELYLEDGATTDAVAVAKAAKLVAQDRSTGRIPALRIARGRSGSSSGFAVPCRTGRSPDRQA